MPMIAIGCASVHRSDAVVAAIDGVKEAVLLGFLVALRVRHLQEPRAEHRRQREADEHRDQDRERHRPSERIDEAARVPGHERDRQEDHHERQRRRHHRQRHLARALIAASNGVQPFSSM